MPRPVAKDYSSTPLSKKLGAKPGTEVVVFFTTRRAELERRFGALKRALAPAGGLWVAWPKRSSGVATDLTEDVIREVALANGLVDAIHTPEPFMSQALKQDGARIVMAPGPVLMPYLPNGVYVARTEWSRADPALARNFRLALNESLVYAQSHPDEIRALLPPAIRDIRLSVWSPVLDRSKLLQLAKFAREFGVISRLPDLTKLVPGTIASGVILQGDVGAKTISLKLDRQPVKTLTAGIDTVSVSDRSAKQNFHLKGPGVDRKTTVRGAGKITWTVTFKAGTYRYFSDANPKVSGSFRVS
jgi:hypothetical protein